MLSIGIRFSRKKVTNCISSLCQILIDQLGDMVLNTDARTLALLSSYGITIDQRIYAVDDAKKFASTFMNQIEKNKIGPLSWVSKKFTMRHGSYKNVIYRKKFHNATTNATLRQRK